MAKEIVPQRITHEVERSLISSWLIGEGLEYIKLFKPSDFSTYGEIFKALSAGKKALDIPSMNIGYTHKDLVDIMSDYSSVFFEQALIRAEQMRISRVGKEILSLSDLRQIHNEIEAVMSYGKVPIAERDIFNRMKADMEYRKNEKAAKYGLRYLDKLTRGIHRKELTTLAARPGVGKSSFAMQVAANVVKQGEKVLYFTLEMSTEQQMYRLMLQTDKARKEELDDYYLNEDVERFTTAIERSGRFQFFEKTIQLAEICAAIKAEKPYLVVIDQLTQVRDRRQKWNSRLEELQTITATLKRVSLDENVAVLLLCQINRDAANSEPTLANLKGSGQIEEDSDNVILLHDKSKKDELSGKPRTSKTIQLKLDKQRSGGTASYDVIFSPQKYRFYEIDIAEGN